MPVSTEKAPIRLGCATEEGATCNAFFTASEEEQAPFDSGIFSTPLMQRALALATSAADEELLTDNLSRLGYRHITTIAFDNRTQEKIGLCIGMKPLGEITRVAVVLRGTQGREWYSNFDVGYGCEHRGFAKAADFAEQQLSDYLFNHFLPGTPVFYLTGYSRGGAVANILAKRLCDRYGVDRVRCYTFASPHTCIVPGGARYHGIFNLVRDEDFFTRVPLSGWGYQKYGMTLSLSDAGDISRRFQQICGREYIGFTRSAEVDEVLGAVMRLAPNVHAYYERRYPSGGRQLSLHEYMLSLADMLAMNADEETADVMMSAMVSEFCDLSTFLSTGMDPAEFLSAAVGIPRCSVADSHSAAAYIAAAETYPA